ncbi:hypothetical protein [Amycolatopsis nigrescens]|uniref:hypothetical protein n=1 Tax=Amycolatopsis nigrescens TaxID=381445 RepID=UPI0009FCC7CB|nr:hypothetical protein [Amycolatopsis nigrescens]
MTTDDTGARPARTVLEQRIWDRRESLERFAEFANTYARQHGEPGTLSYRHLRRLVAGRGEGGKPLGRPQAATARLLEHIFSTSIDELLSPPPGVEIDTSSDDKLRAMLRSSARVDQSVLALLQDQLTAIRRLDRQLGAVVTHDEVLTKATQVSRLMTHSLAPAIREQLAGLLSELCALAGWQALDMSDITTSWQHYDRGRLIARDAGNPAFESYTAAGQAFVLLDLHEASSAVELLAATRQQANGKVNSFLQAWLAAAEGEALAANKQGLPSLDAFDHASTVLLDKEYHTDGPYVALDFTHLARWRGHAMARLGHPDAVNALTSTLSQLDTTFMRARTALQIDLAMALGGSGEFAMSKLYIEHAKELAISIGSKRQRNLIGPLIKYIKTSK